MGPDVQRKMGSIRARIVSLILLDTHVAIWLLAAPEQLSLRARNAIQQAWIAGEKIAYSPVSLYEIVYSARRKRLQLHVPTADFIGAIQTKLELAPLTARIAISAAELPAPFHGDQIDRMIAATAIVEDCTLITRDEHIHRANVCKVLW
jgi:PIN domain nuclease of toxin-antitoxin system